MTSPGWPYDSLEAKRKYIETWAKEFIATMKNLSGYYYVFSFWVLKAVPADHPRVAVWAQPGCIRTIL